MVDHRHSPTKPGVISARVENYWRITLDDGDVEHMDTGELNYDNVEVGDRVAVTYCNDGRLRATFVAPKVGRQS